MYQVDFAAMTQTNIGSGHVRKIKKSDPMDNSLSPTSGHEYKMEWQPVVATSAQKFFKVQISGLQDYCKDAETKLVQELDKTVVKKFHSIPGTADRVFRTEILQTLHKYLVSPEIVRDSVQVQGVQGYIEKVMLMVREKMLDFEKEHLARINPAAQHSAVRSLILGTTDRPL